MGNNSQTKIKNSVRLSEDLGFPVVRIQDVLYESPWGIFLSAKIILYMIMILSALFVVIFIGPRLKKGVKEAVHHLIYGKTALI